jgi:hypothetical protein
MDEGHFPTALFSIGAGRNFILFFSLAFFPGFTGMHG